MYDGYAREISLTLVNIMDSLEEISKSLKKISESMDRDYLTEEEAREFLEGKRNLDGKPLP